MHDSKLSIRLNAQISRKILLKLTQKEIEGPGESQGRGSLVGCHLWGRTELDTTEVT